MYGLKGLNAVEKTFAWKLQQDMLHVGSRIHRRNAERRCLMGLDGGAVCEEVQTRFHLFAECEAVKGRFELIKTVLKDYLQKEVDNNEIIHLAFNHRNKRKLSVALWFATKALYLIYQGKVLNKTQLLKEIIKEIDWNLRLNLNVGSKSEIYSIRVILVSYLGN